MRIRGKEGVGSIRRSIGVQVGLGMLRNDNICLPLALSAFIKHFRSSLIEYKITEMCYS